MYGNLWNSFIYLQIVGTHYHDRTVRTNTNYVFHFSNFEQTVLIINTAFIVLKMVINA